MSKRYCGIRSASHPTDAIEGSHILCEASSEPPGQDRLLPEPLLPARAVAGLLGVSERTLRRWDKSGLLVPRRLGSILRYHPGDIDAFIAGSDSKK